MTLVSWIPAFAGMTRGHKHWQCIYEMDIWVDETVTLRGYDGPLRQLAFLP